VIITCNIAGYVGTEPAAPILLEMIEAQEGLAGGFYTGIATLDGDTLHHVRVVGDCSALRDCISDLSLPGTIGLAHSRSNSGGDCLWAHPFVVDERLAYIANGSVGCFEGKTDLCDLATSLEQSGRSFTAVADEQIGNYPSLPGGRSVHMSDVMAHAIDEALSRLGPLEALEDAFLRIPSEIVGVSIDSSQDKHIYLARWNMPACACLAGNGVRIASSPVAFEPGASWEWIPPGSVAEIAADGWFVRPMGEARNMVCDDIDRAKAREAVLDRLEKSACGVGALLKTVRPLSNGHELVVACDPVYEVLCELELEGRIRRERRQVDGAYESTPGAQFIFHAV